MAAISHVYAKCSAGNRMHLETMFSGSRYLCEAYIRNRVRQGQPTHFLFISKMDPEKAVRRWL